MHSYLWCMVIRRMGLWITMLSPAGGRKKGERVSSWALVYCAGGTRRATAGRGAGWTYAARF